MESRELPTGAGLAVREVVVSFGGITALEGVSVDVSPGEVLGVIGPNGAGKTTLFNVICGFVAAELGHAQLARPAADARPPRIAWPSLGIARTLQGVGLFAGLTVLENVMVGAQRFRSARLVSALLGLPWSDRDERALRERALAALRAARLRRRRRPAARDAALRGPEAGRAGPRAGRPSPSCCCSTSPPAGSTPTSCPSSAS